MGILYNCHLICHKSGGYFLEAEELRTQFGETPKKIQLLDKRQEGSDLGTREISEQVKSYVKSSYQK